MGNIQLNSETFHLRISEIYLEIYTSVAYLNHSVWKRNYETVENAEFETKAFLSSSSEPVKKDAQPTHESVVIEGS